MTTGTAVDVAAEVRALTSALASRADPGYVAGMRRTVPSQLPAHAVRVPEIRRIAAAWSREHKSAAAPEVIAVAEALWQTCWREECMVAMAIVARSKATMASFSWEVVARWSAAIENWEHVDNFAGMVTGPLLGARPDLISNFELLAGSDHSWQRRLAIVTLIEVTRDDAAWKPHLEAMAAALQGDRGPTMRKAVVWARRVLREVGSV